MVNLTINGQKISVSEGTTILEAALKVGIDIPHLCYLKDINEIGACRVCVVENAGMETLVTACNTPVEEGMELYTNTSESQRGETDQRKPDPFGPRCEMCDLRTKR